MTAIVFFTGLPPRGHGGNGSQGGWRKKSAERAAYRAEVFADAKARRNGLIAWAAADGRQRVSLVFGTAGGRVVKRYQPRDVPNAIAAFKGGFDGLTDAGLIVDDSARSMELGTVEIDSKRGPWVRVTVESVEAIDAMD